MLKKLTRWVHPSAPHGMFVAILFGAALLPMRSGASENPERKDVFVSGVGGYHTYRIPAIVGSTRGTLLAFCEGRKDSASDTGAIDLVLKRSQDGGNTWSEQQVIRSDGRNVCGNPAPVVDRDTGRIWLLTTWNLGSDSEAAINEGKSRDTRRIFVSSSDDDGVSWASPKEITEEVKPSAWRWYATGPVNGIQLRQGAHQGRLVVPANHTEVDQSGKVVSRSHVIYSDDHGASWRLGGSEEKLTNESTVVELDDGTLLHNMRSYRGDHRRAVATSRDGGISWSAVRSDPALIEPVCQASLLRYTGPEGGHKSRILFCNPAGLKRENLTLRLSYDGGRTWPGEKVLYAGPSAYSCLTELPDQTIGCLFECGEKQPYERIVLARVSLNSLEQVPQRH